MGARRVRFARVRFALLGLALAAPLVWAAPPAGAPTAVSGAGRCAAAELIGWTPAETGGPAGESVGSCLRRLGRGKTDARLPADQRYVLTTFGGPGDEQPVDCRDPRGADGLWYYAANLQRFACGQKVRLVDLERSRCVVVEVADSGPHVCVEEASGRPIWDVSPLAAQHLLGVRSTGWSNRRGVYGAPVDGSNPLGPCDAQLADAAQIARGSVGGPCEDATQCRYDGALCLRAEAGWPSGYCSAPCSGACPALPGPHSLAVCSQLEDGSAGCLARCDFTLHASGCRAGYRCGSAPVPGGAAAPNPVCLPDRCPWGSP